MATIKDVAKLAGVSITTVSHVMNKTRFVSAKNTARVLDAVSELNYSPSMIARSLKVSTTKSIGMIVTTCESPFIAEIILATERHCYEMGYSLLLCNTQNNEDKIQNHLDMLMNKRVDGILVMCSEYTDNSLALLNRTNIPMVVMDWGHQDPNNDLINDNGEIGGYLATKHLIENGHKDIAIIAGNLKKTISKNRFDGFLRAMQEKNLEVNQDWIFEGDFEPEDGFEMMDNILQLEGKYPTAVFCFNDAMALGAISAINNAGLKVPDDISVIGYDDIHNSRFYAPPLTTIHQSKSRLSDEALALLMERIQAKANDEACSQRKPTILNFMPELVVRNSVLNLHKK